MAEFTTVFLSSTAKDLQPWRNAVYEALNQVRGVHCERMEDFGAIDAAPAEACRQRVAECEVFIGLVGHFFGSAPEGSERSYTQIEYDEAVRLGKPRLLFLADDDFPLSPRLGREAEEKYASQVAFRQEVGRERLVSPFNDSDHLATVVATSLGNLLKEMAGERQRGAAESKPMAGSAFGAGGASPGSAHALGSGSVAAASGAIAAGRDLVLNQVMHQTIVQAAGPVSDETALRRAYLGRLLGKLEHLILSGVDPAVKDGQNDPRMKLRAIYTALRTGVREAGEGPDSKGRAVPREAMEERGLLSALEVLDREKRLVLLGGPGSGKSTFVSFVALCLAGELVGHSESNLAALNGAERVLQEADRRREEDGVAGRRPGQEKAEAKEPALVERWHHGPLLPVRIVLRDFAAWGGLPPTGERATAKCLADFVERELAEDFAVPEFSALLKRELEAGRCLVLLDGLDEVPEAGERREQIVQAVKAWTDGFGASRVLVTSRTYAYQNQAWKLDDFAEAELEPFDEAQIGQFVGLWYGQMVALGRCQHEEAAHRSQQLREAIFGSDRLLALARQPLLLTLTASLHAWRRGELPKRREGLYRESVELLLESWERRLQTDSRGRPLEPQPSLAEWLRAGPEEVRRALNELAFEAHAVQEDMEGTADLQGSRVIERLFALNKNPDFKPAQLLAYLRDRAGLLVERGNDLFTFPHRTFQEYLAACHLKQKFQPADIADLARSDPGRWREVLLLAAGDATAAASWVWDLAEDLCPLEKDGEAIGEDDRWGALFAAQVVVESADRRWLEEPEGAGDAEGGSGRVGKAHQKRVAGLREWVDHLKWRSVDLMRTGTFPVRERALAGKLLAELGDPRFDPDHWFLPKEPDFGFLKVPAGKFWMGSDPKLDRAANNVELPQHELELPTFWLARFLVTVSQFEAFVAASGYSMPNDSWRQAPANQPVAYVTWDAARTYCQWLDARLREVAPALAAQVERSCELWPGLASGLLGASLPSSAEWEKSARGSEARIYPWGNEPDPNRANCQECALSERSSVGCFPGGSGPYFHEELAGNVWEWTRSLAQQTGEVPSFGYPYDPSDGRENLDPRAGRREVRGGAFNNGAAAVRCVSAAWAQPIHSNVDLGFRVALVQI